jgi:hypothetical protein
VLCALWCCLIASCTPYNNVREEGAIVVQTAPPAQDLPQPEDTPEVEEIQPEAPEEAPAKDDPPVTPVPEDETSTEPSTEEQSYSVSQEVYQRTFTEIERTIQELNTIIQQGDFETWTTYLTWEYIDEMSSPENLRKMSDRPILRKYNVKLESLQDYFRFVVVPSRSHVRLDDIVFLNEGRVKAIMEVDGQRIILYQLEKRDDTWKIGIW